MSDLNIISNRSFFGSDSNISAIFWFNDGIDGIPVDDLVNERRGVARRNFHRNVAKLRWTHRTGFREKIHTWPGRDHRLLRGRASTGSTDRVAGKDTIRCSSRKKRTDGSGKTWFDSPKAGKDRFERATQSDGVGDRDIRSRTFRKTVGEMTLERWRREKRWKTGWEMVSWVETKMKTSMKRTYHSNSIQFRNIDSFFPFP